MVVAIIITQPINMARSLALLGGGFILSIVNDVKAPDGMHRTAHDGRVDVRVGVGNLSMLRALFASTRDVRFNPIRFALGQAEEPDLRAQACEAEVFFWSSKLSLAGLSFFAEKQDNKPDAKQNIEANGDPYHPIRVGIDDVHNGSDESQNTHHDPASEDSPYCYTICVAILCQPQNHRQGKIGRTPITRDATGEIVSDYVVTVHAQPERRKNKPHQTIDKENNCPDKEKRSVFHANPPEKSTRTNYSATFPLRLLQDNLIH